MDELQADLTESLYAILLGEADWSRFLSLLVADRINGGALFMLQNDSTSGGLGRLELAAGVEERQITDYADYYSQRNPWVPDHILRRQNDVIVDHEVISREELRRTEYYNDFLRPAGYQGSTGVTLSRRGGESMLLTTVFGDEDPEIATLMGRRMEAMKPHLQRVMKHYARLGHEAQPGDFAAQALNAIGAGLVMIGDDLKPGLVTPPAESAARAGLLYTVTPTGRLRLSHDPAQVTLSLMLRRGYSGPATLVWQQRGYRLTLFRAAREAVSELLCGPMAGLIIEPADHVPAPVQMDEMKRRYGLTTAEMRVLSGVSQGLTIRAMASAHNRSVETVRSQVKSLLHKTGAESQLALLHLLNGR